MEKLIIPIKVTDALSRLLEVGKVKKVAWGNKGFIYSLVRTREVNHEVTDG